MTTPGTHFATSFGGLVLAQTAHSVEEYLSRLWVSFPPARWVSGLIANDLEVGFILVNLLLLSFGLWCWLVPVRRRWPSAPALAWGWVLVESTNAVGHSLWSIRQGGYTPGVGTAPLLLLASLLLARQLRQRARWA